MTAIVISLLISITCLITLLYLYIFVEDNKWTIEEDRCEFAIGMVICLCPFFNLFLLGVMIYTGLLHLVSLGKVKLNDFIAEKVKSIMEEEKAPLKQRKKKA